MLRVENLSVAYDGLKAIEDVSFEMREGEFVALIGSNGAGKSTLLNTLIGLLTPSSGAIYFEGERIDALAPAEIVDRGLVLVPEGKWAFPQMSVMENLLMGAYPRRCHKQMRQTLDQVFSLFPRLEERQKQMAHTLSGGELQMLVIGRGLMAQPRLLMLDEPSLGLAPRMVLDTFAVLERLHSSLGLSIILAEQNVSHALRLSDRAMVLENGRLAMEGQSSALLNDPEVKVRYLGM
ncbi:MAG: ABC transporter ATP-binding protein [Chloroflexota bacterium]